MAGAEERRGGGRGRTRSAGDQRVWLCLGVAVAALILARAAPAQTPPAGTPATPGGGGDTGAAPAGGTPAAPGTTGTPETGAAATPGGGAAAAELRGPAWTILPSVSASEAFTDNVFATPTQRQSDLISTLAPDLFISGESARLHGVFEYSPALIKYLANSSQDQVQQNLFTNGTLTAVPDLFFIDGNASISTQSRQGGRGFNNTSQIPTTQSTQTAAYSGSPYLRLHFGADGDAEFRYTFSQTVFNGNTGPVTDSLTGQNLGSLSNATQHAVSFSYNTGEALSRLQFGFLSSYVQLISGSGGLDSRHATDTVSATYAVTDAVSALFGGGYEKLVYPQLPADNFSGPNWSLGARYRPREDRQITLSYGESEGQDTFAGSMLYALTGDATLSGSYSQQNTTQQQQILQNLGASTLTAPGLLPTNPTTQLPQTITNPNLALQNGVFRAQNLQLGLAVTRARNHYQALFSRSEQTSLSGGSTSQTTDGGVVSWGRDLSPVTTGAVSAGYSTTTSGASAGVAAAPGIAALTVAVSLNVTLGPSLTAGANYALSRQTGGSTGAVVVDTVSVSLRKTF